MKAWRPIPSAVCVVVLSLACASPASAAPFYKRPTFWNRLSQVCAGAANGGDIASTMTALATRRGVEANVFLAHVKNPAIAGAVKAGGAVGGMIFTAELFKHKPKTAIAMNFATCGVVGYVAHQNMNIVRTGRR